MNILYLTGSQGAGKTIAITAMQKMLGGRVINVASATQGRDAILDTKGPRVYIDFQRHPSPTLLAFAIENLRRNGVEHLVLAHN